MATIDPEHVARNSVWLVAHERNDPMTLAQTEYTLDEAVAELRRVLNDCVSHGAHVDPPLDHGEIGRRFDVHDANGWLATYWLSEEQLPRDEGMLTAIVSPGARQRAHHTQPRR